MTANGFTMKGYKQTQVPLWNDIKNNCEPGKSPYLGGLQEIGEKEMCRTRKEQKELHKVAFNATVSPD